MARSNVALLAEQAREFSPAYVACTDESAATLDQLRATLPQAQHGIDTLTTAATHPEVEMVVAATSGLVGVSPTLAAIRAGKTIALANKETLVMAGHLVMAEARRRASRFCRWIASTARIWQCLRGERAEEVRRLLVTASGGPFRTCPLDEMARVTVEQALEPPHLADGAKITIDSATLMNKGLEVIEAHWLFGMPYEQIEVVVHPQSVIHSMVEFVDDSIKMQASLPSMHLPIQDALELSRPAGSRADGARIRCPGRRSRRLDFEDGGYGALPLPAPGV